MVSEDDEGAEVDWDQIVDHGQNLEALILEQDDYLFDEWSRNPSATPSPPAIGTISSQKKPEPGESGRTAPTTLAKSTNTLTAKDRKRPRMAIMAASLKVPTHEYELAFKRHDEACHAVLSKPKRDRLAAAAKLLGLTPEVLREFRSALASPPDVQKSTSAQAAASHLANRGRAEAERALPSAKTTASHAMEPARPSSTPSAQPTSALLQPDSTSLAACLRMSPGELKTLRHRFNQAWVSTKHLSATERDLATANSLDLTVPTFRSLRDALFGKLAPDSVTSLHAQARGVVCGPGPRPIPTTAGTDSWRVRELIKGVISPTAKSGKQRPKGAAVTPRTQRERQPAISNAIRDGLEMVGVGGPSTSEKLSKRTFYVADFSNKVHLVQDCHGLLRGFKNPSEPDSRVFKVTLREQHCAGKIACKKCIDAGFQGRVNSAISSIHGKQAPVRRGTGRTRKRRRP